MDGILVGCDTKQEWLLSWWYHNLRKHNPDIPIAFGDLGMSEDAKHWCEKRGTLIPVFQIPSISMPTNDTNGWLYAGEKWRCLSIPSFPQRFTLFRKPFLMKQSPFNRTLWLDLDCQVLDTISPLFSLRLPSTKLAIRRDPFDFKMVSTEKRIQITANCYNSGVVLFEKSSHLLDIWISLTHRACDNFATDDQILGFAISKYHFPVAKIPYKYNWITAWGNNPEASVLHWAGEPSKIALRLKYLWEQSNLT